MLIEAFPVSFPLAWVLLDNCTGFKVVREPCDVHLPLEMFGRYFTMTSLTVVFSPILFIPNVIFLWNSNYRQFYGPMCRDQSLLFPLYFGMGFAGKTVLLRWSARARFAFSISFTIFNTLHPTFILYCIEKKKMEIYSDDLEDLSNEKKKKKVLGYFSWVRFIFTSDFFPIITLTKDANIELKFAIKSAQHYYCLYLML